MSKRTGIMLPVLFTEKLFKRLPKPVFVQAKIEGDRMRAKIEDGNVNLLSSGGKERTSVPHISAELYYSGLKDVELDGELYRHGMEHSEIRSIVSRTKNLHPDHEKIRYYVYDIVSEDKQEKRLKHLSDIFMYNNFEHLRHVTYHIVHTLEKMQYYYDMFLEEGYEGIIIRHPYTSYTRRKVSTMLKLKPRVSDYFKIVGVVEEVSIQGERKNTFGAFICKTHEGALFSVGTGPTKPQRDFIWRYREIFKGRRVKIRFQDYTKVRHVPKMQSIDKQWLKDM